MSCESLNESYTPMLSFMQETADQKPFSSIQFFFVSFFFFFLSLFFPLTSIPDMLLMPYKTANAHTTDWYRAYTFYACTFFFMNEQCFVSLFLIFTFLSLFLCVYFGFRGFIDGWRKKFKCSRMNPTKSEISERKKSTATAE